MLATVRRTQIDSSQIAPQFIGTILHDPRIAARVPAPTLTGTALFVTTPRMVGDVPGFERAGQDQILLDAFPGRRHEILTYLDKHGLPHTREALRPIRRCRPRRREVVEPVAHVFRDHRIDAPITDAGSM